MQEGSQAVKPGNLQRYIQQLYFIGSFTQPSAPGDREDAEVLLRLLLSLSNHLPEVSNMILPLANHLA